MPTCPARSSRLAAPNPSDPARQQRLRALGLVLPLLVFILITFIAPLATMLVRSVHDPVVADALPGTLASLAGWEGEGLPDEAAYETLARELVQAREERTLGQVAGRVNRVRSGLRSVFTRSARSLRDVTEGALARSHGGD